MAAVAAARDSVLVTGATGFVGASVIAALHRRLNAPVIGVARASAEPPGLASYRSVDLTDAFDLRAELARARAVVHLASRVHVMRETDANPEAAFRRANVEATERLARQAAEAGVPRFVFMSTIKVNGERTEGRPFTELDPPNPQDAYARSKAEAERGLAEIARATGMAVVALRPPLVFGARARANFAALLRLTARAPALPFGALRNRRNLIHVDHLADAAVAACAAGALAPGSFAAYVVADPEAVSTSDLVRSLGLGLGRQPMLLPVPAAALRALGRLTGRDAAVARLTEDLEIDPSGFMRDFGWRPERGVRAALAACAREWNQARSV